MMGCAPSIGRTRGFWWEVQHVLEQSDPRKVLIYLPKGDRRAHYQYLREQLAGVLPHPLPEQVGRASFLAFSPNWEPRLLGATGSSGFAWFRRLLTGSPAAIVRDAINPSLAAAGVAPRRMPFKFHEWVALIGVVIAALSLLVLVPLFFIAQHGMREYEYKSLEEINSSERLRLEEFDIPRDEIRIPLDELEMPRQELKFPLENLDDVRPFERPIEPLEPLAAPEELRIDELPAPRLDEVPK